MTMGGTEREGGGVTFCPSLSFALLVRMLNGEGR